MHLFDYLEPLKMIYLGVFYLGNLIETLINKKWFGLCENSVFVTIIMSL